MSVQGTTIINPGDNYHFPRNKCSFGYVLNTNGTESGQCVIYPMGSGKIQKTLTPQQTFSWKNEEIDYIYNSGSIPLEIIFSDEAFELSKSQAFQQTDIGQANTYMKDDKIPNPLNLDQYGNIGIGLPPFAINPTDRSWFLGTSDLPNRSWNLGTGDSPSRSWTLGSSDGPDITLNQSNNFFQMPNVVTQKAYYTQGGTQGAGFWFNSVASYPVFIRLKKLYMAITGNNDPSNQIKMAIFTNQSLLSPENYTNYDPISTMVNNRHSASISGYYVPSFGSTSNGATTIPYALIDLDYFVWLSNTESLYIEIGAGMFTSSTTDLYNVTMSIQYETNAPNSTSGYQVYPYATENWGSAIGSEDTDGSSILIR
jgi:hypothetical protein